MINFIFSLKPWLRITLGLLYLVLIVLLSLLPTSNLPDIPFFSGEDKMIHFCMYLGLGFVTCWSLDMRGKRMPSLYLLLAGVFAWGVLMEILQRLMSNGRGMDVWDMLANLAGAIAGLIVYRFLDRKWMLDTVNVKANE
jgi:VanZ family protein